ncbi:MAG: hypothetical protein HKN82_11240, partial [Akkermansiaceae bacterium]|nr:hypothetical protein [Akkermansiaceae bacterium]
MKRHLALLGAGLLATAANTLAINITLVDITDPGDYPNFDPTGANVLPLLQAAANRWEDIIEDNVNVTINWRYRNVTGLASATVLNFNGAGQPIECRINIDNDEGVRTWYFDPTPTNHSEYDLVQRIYRDLTTVQQDNWFGPFAADKPTTLLESSYRGVDNATAPANARNGFD